MRNKFVIPLLFLALIASLGWGYTQQQARRQWEINAENQYQRAFADLNGHVSNMETSIAKAMVSGSFSQIIQQLMSTYREANFSQENLGQLPLTSVELGRTKMALAKISAFCFNDAQSRLLRGNALTGSEWNTLKTCQLQTRVIARHINAMRDRFANDRTRWLEVDSLGTLGAVGLPNVNPGNNKVTKAFLMLEDGLRRVPDLHFTGNNLDFTPKPTGLTGSDITPREAVALARRFAPELSGWQFSYERKIGGDLPSYMVKAAQPKSGARAGRAPGGDHRFSISKKGGHVIWMLGDRTVRQPRLGYPQAVTRAQAFLRRNRYPEMRLVGAERYSNIATLTFVPYENQVVRYPELIKTQVALDNGEILGFDATGYLTFNNPQEKAAAFRPKYSEPRIRKLLNPHLTVKRIDKAQVLDQMFNKVSCYEVEGTQGSDRYLLYYNAMTGKEEKIRRIDKNGNEIQ